MTILTGPSSAALSRDHLEQASGGIEARTAAKHAGELQARLVHDMHFPRSFALFCASSDEHPPSLWRLGFRVRCLQIVRAV